MRITTKKIHADGHFELFLLAYIAQRVQNNSMLRSLVIMTTAAAMVAPAFAAVEWMTDLEAALAKAKVEGKCVLVDFTGSDWCGWCVQLRKDVLDHADFVPFLAANFVAVEIDVPQDASRVGGVEQLEKNQRLCDKFAVEGYPTIMVMTPEGHVVGGFVGGADMQEAKEALELALTHARSLKKAAALQGEAKAQMLMPVYKTLQENFPSASKALREELLELMPHNEQLQAEAELDAIKAKFEQVPEDDYDTILAMLDAEIKSAMPTNQDLLKRSKAAILEVQIVNELAAAQSVDDVVTARRRLMEEVVSLLPPDRQVEVLADIETELGDPQAVFDAIEAQRKEEAANALSEADSATLQEVMSRIQNAEDDPDAALRILDEELAEANDVVRKHLISWKITTLMDKGSRLAETAQTAEDVMGLRDIAVLLVELSEPDDAARAEALQKVEQEFADPAAVLEKLRQQREAEVAPPLN